LTKKTLGNCNLDAWIESYTDDVVYDIKTLFTLFGLDSDSKEKENNLQYKIQLAKLEELFSPTLKTAEDNTSYINQKIQFQKKLEQENELQYEIKLASLQSLLGCIPTSKN
jgi:hypothetical protein